MTILIILLNLSHILG